MIKTSNDQIIMLVQHQLIGLSVCQSGRFFLSSLPAIYPVSSQVSINLQLFIFRSLLLGFLSYFMISSFNIFDLVIFVETSLPHIDNTTATVGGCSKFWKENFSKFSSWIPDAKLILICSKLPVWICDAKQVGFVENGRAGFVMRSRSLNGIQIFIRRCKANLTGSPNSDGERARQQTIGLANTIADFTSS